MNTLQALALPKGSRLQFRYVQQIISEGLRERLSQRTLVGSTVLLGYVDCTPAGRSSNGRCFIVPYRQAQLVDSRRMGSIFVLQFELGPLRRSADLENFQRTLSENSPRWKQDTNGRFEAEDEEKPVLEGYWCQETSPELLGTSVADDFQGWQAIVEQLAQRKDFQAQPYFYMVEGIFRREKGTVDGVRVDLAAGEYHLEARREYELRVLHYDPPSGAHGANRESKVLKLEVSAPLLALRSSPVLVVDSPYDLKSVHFGSGDTNRLAYGSLFLQPQGSKPEEQPLPELYFPVAVKGDAVRLVLNGLLLGGLLTLTQGVAVFSKGFFDGWRTVAVLIAVLGFATGLFVSLGMRKPL